MVYNNRACGRYLFPYCGCGDGGGDGGNSSSFSCCYCVVFIVDDEGDGNSGRDGDIVVVGERADGLLLVQECLWCCWGEAALLPCLGHDPPTPGAMNSVTTVYFYECKETKLVL